MAVEGDVTWDGDAPNNMQTMLQSCAPDMYMILLANVTTINSIKIKAREVK